MFDYLAYRKRYSQHILFYEAGVDDREKVYSAKVAVIGLGSIGIEAARLLAIAGVKLLRLISWQSGAGAELQQHADCQAPADCLPQGMAAAQALAAENPDIAFEIVDCGSDSLRLENLLRDTDVVLYQTDSAEGCRVISNVCRSLNKPWIFAEARGGFGMTANMIPGETVCIGCLKNKLPSDDSGLQYAPTVTDLIARVMSQVQAMESLKILGNSQGASAEVFCFDVDNFSRTVNIARTEGCPICN